MVKTYRDHNLPKAALLERGRPALPTLPCWPLLNLSWKIEQTASHEPGWVSNAEREAAATLEITEE